MTQTTTLHGVESASTRNTASSLSVYNYAFLQRYIYRESGIVLDADKHYLFKNRLLPIVREEKLASLDALCERLASERYPKLAALVVDAMTTNETLFFRDAAIFDVMKSNILPSLLAAAGAARSEFGPPPPRPRKRRTASR